MSEGSESSKVIYLVSFGGKDLGSSRLFGR